MGWCRRMKRIGTFVLAAVMAAGLSFISEASMGKSGKIPLTLHMDVTSRQISIYDGYTSYVTGYRVSETDTFTVTRDNNNVNLDDVTLNYYLLTYDGETQKYLECTVRGLKEDTHYPVVRPETVEREKEEGLLYDTLERCYLLEFCYGDNSEVIYYNILPDEEMSEYRNIYLGKWDKQLNTKWRYIYQGEYLTSWARINGSWYMFGEDGYMKTGWQEYKNQWYYMDPGSGKMRKDCVIDGYRLDESGVRVSDEAENAPS